MADITLAEWNGNVWLVAGEALVDDMLANTLPPGISIEIIACASKDEVRRLWIQLCGEPGFTGDPWLIHPAIVARIRRASPDYPVFFSQWSAMLDAEALAVVAAAAAWAGENPEAPVTLADYRATDGVPALADLSRLRVQLIAARLQEAGIGAERITHLSRDLADLPGADAAPTADTQRIDIIVRVSEPGSA